MQEDNLSDISKTVIKHFTKTVAKLDKKAKFVKRRSKLGAKLFLEALVLGCMSDPAISLEGICSLIKERNVKISKQGLDQRFTPEAVTLAQNFFMETVSKLKTERRNVLDLLKPFSCVNILDSSAIQLPGNLRDVYKGTGGPAEAGLKIQVLFDYIQGQVSQAIITEGNKPDQSYNGHLNQIEAGALYLQDLGYFKLDSLGLIQQKDAYFVSRYYYPTTVLGEDGVAINLIKELRKCGSSFTRMVSLGKEGKIKVRLIAFRLSDEDRKKRIRKLRKSAQKKGRIPTKETLELAQWSIYVTNVSADILTDEQIYLIYSLRWQIELFFKLCKSEVGIAKIKGKKLNRILCEIYAKLICVVMLLYLCFPLRWQENVELSFRKAYKQLSLRAVEFFRALKSKYLLLKFIGSFLNIIKDFATKDRRRKKRLLTYKMLMRAASQEVLV